MQTGTGGVMALIVAILLLAAMAYGASLLVRRCAPWIAGSRTGAYLGAVVLSVAAILLMPFGLWLVGGLVVFVRLRGGPVSDARMALATGLLLAFYLYAQVGIGPVAAALIGVAATLPALLLGRLAARGDSLRPVFQIATLGALAFVVVVHVVLADPPGVWRPFVERAAAELDRMGTVMSHAGLAQPDEQNFIQASAQRMWGVVSWLLLLTAMISVFLGTYWQGRMTNRALLGPKFRELAAGRTLAVLALVALGATVVFRSGLAADASLVLLGALVLQGLAILHAACYAYGLGTPWLVFLYALLFSGLTTAIMLIFLAISGFVDNWFPVRGRFPARQGA
ncbi:MAG: DUF2232 domain-containing protein [Proteobacteria bacterium]|nr:DUF2232 domain-containing protein [Pseudomonadota bacterium]